MSFTKLYTELGVGKTTVFSDLYYMLSKRIVEDGSKVNSRNGKVMEYLNFKTVVTNPRARCVGGWGRDINVFFLLAEALWIWCGRKDVAFLHIFNKRMKEFSDDGIVFHAPYGFRLRHYGVSSFDKGSNDSQHQLDGYDQLLMALEMLKNNSEDRRVVLSIWNPDLDLSTKSKDLPCNDMLMFKIRENSLYQTISNRSNDLHWGLPTNVFQFSIIGELMSLILGVELGEQVHNSQSLHAYYDNELTHKMYENFSNKDSIGIYDLVAHSNMDIDFTSDSGVSCRLREVDLLLSTMIDNLRMICYNDASTDADTYYTRTLITKSKYFYMVYMILKTYALYSKSQRTTEDKLIALDRLMQLKKNNNGWCDDYLLLAMNFFASRIDDKDLDLVKGIFNNDIVKHLGTL